MPKVSAETKHVETAEEVWGDEVEGVSFGTLIKFPEDEQTTVVGVVTGVSDVESTYTNEDGSKKNQRRYDITVDGEK